MKSHTKPKQDKFLSLSGKSAAALAIGLGFGVCAAQQADAVVIHSSETGFTPVTLSDYYYQIDMNSDGIDDFVFYHYFFDFYSSSDYNGSGVYAGISTNPFNFTSVVAELNGYHFDAKNLNSGNIVGPGDSFYPNYNYGMNYGGFLTTIPSTIMARFTTIPSATSSARTGTWD